MQATVKSRLQQMDDYDFEHFVGDLWERMGWTCEVSQASADAGIDVVATKSDPYPQKKLIQAKRYGPNTTVGGPAIQQYASLRHQQPNVDSVVVVTTNQFTRAAEQRADELNVKLVDGDGLVSMVDNLQAENLLTQYDIDASEGSQSQVQPQHTPPRGSTPSVKEDQGLLSRIGSGRNWYQTLLKSSGVAVVVFLIDGLLLNSGIGVLEALGGVLSLVWAVALVVVGVSLYFDIRHVRRHSSWNPTAWMYLLGLFVFYITLPVYFYRRRRSLTP